MEKGREIVQQKVDFTIVGVADVGLVENVLFSLKELLHQAEKPLQMLVQGSNRFDFSASYEPQANDGHSHQKLVHQRQEELDFVSLITPLFRWVKKALFQNQPRSPLCQIIDSLLGLRDQGQLVLLLERLHEKAVAQGDLGLPQDFHVFQVVGDEGLVLLLKLLRLLLPGLVLLQTFQELTHAAGLLVKLLHERLCLF